MVILWGNLILYLTIKTVA